jgi:hypothetical protein
MSEPEPFDPQWQPRESQPSAGLAARLPWLGLQAGLVLGLWAVLAVVNPEYAGLLFRHPTGVKLVVGALALLVVYFAGSLLLYVALDQMAPPRDDSQRAVRRSHAGLLVGVMFIVFYLPAVFVILVGPAAIRIMDSLGSVKAP